MLDLIRLIDPMTITCERQGDSAKWRSREKIEPSGVIERRAPRVPNQRTDDTARGRRAWPDDLGNGRRHRRIFKSGGSFV